MGAVPETSTSEKLYQLLAERLAEQGESLPCTQDALRVYAKEPRADIDYLKLINLDNRSLVDACYSIAFNTYPPVKYVEQWSEDIEGLSRDEFHKKFMNSFIKLHDFSTQQVRLRNCIYISAPAMIRAGVGKELRSWTYKTFLPVYKRLPGKCKNVIKILLWDKFFVR